MVLTRDVTDRYRVSKLLEVLVVRQLAKLIDQSTNKSGVIINCLNPGLCHSDLTRDAEGFVRFVIGTLKTLLARTTEVGSRTLVHAAAASRESHGQYLSDCQVNP